MFERKKNEEIKGLIRICGWLFNTQYNLSYQSFVQNFKILSQAVPEKSLTENVHMQYIGMRDGKKKKNWKRRQNNY